MRFSINDAFFEWDEQKAIDNMAKHGVTFEQACTVFLDPFFRQVDASDPAGEETRDGVIGYSSTGKMLFVVSVERSGGEAIRIISARRATNQERMIYENQ